jgi:hypothetical protein
MKNTFAFASIALFICALASAGKTSATVKVIKSLNDCNVVWDSPSADSFGSMPLGNTPRARTLAGCVPSSKGVK